MRCRTSAVFSGIDRILVRPPAVSPRRTRACTSAASACRTRSSKSVGTSEGDDLAFL